jgi:hypothetical protein
VKKILIRLSHLFLEDLMAVVRLNSSALKAPSVISPKKPNDWQQYWAAQRAIACKTISTQGTNI